MDGIFTIVTAWWFWLPIAGLLVFLTYRNNKKARMILKKRSEAEEQTAKNPDTSPHSTRLTEQVSESFLQELSLRGIYKHRTKK